MSSQTTTGTAVATTEPKSVLVTMSKKYGMEPSAFEATVRQQCSPAGRDARELTREEFAALMLVANEYNLNPITREIYAFPKRGGGIVPIVSVDGWVSLVNSHGSMDGLEFSVEHDEAGKLVSCTCRIFRKDRSKPVEVTEYLSECVRETEPWKMKHRMLRHKALIQCARYAFGFSGIYDEDEGERIISNAETPPPPPPPPVSDPPAPPKDAVDAEFTETKPTTTFDKHKADLAAAIARCGSEGELEAVWRAQHAPTYNAFTKEQKDILKDLAGNRKAEITAAKTPVAQQETPAFNIDALRDEFDRRATDIKGYNKLDQLWADMIDTAHEAGHFSEQQKIAVFGPVYDGHRARIDSMFHADRED